MSTTSNVFNGRKLGARAGDGKNKPVPPATPAPATTPELEPTTQAIRIILADSEAIFRVGMSKIFAQQEDLEVVAQTESLAQTLNAVASTSADVILFEAGLSPNPADAISEVGRRALPGAKLIMVTQRAGEQETVDYLRRGVRGILARAATPELLVRCVRKVAAGETWLDKQGVNWVIEAYRTQALQGTAPQRQLRLSPKEMMIINGVTQGMKNKDIAHEVGTTEQVVKNYLRKIYDKLNVADRLELALYTMHHRLLEGYVAPNGDPNAAKAKLAAEASAASPEAAQPAAEKPPAEKAATVAASAATSKQKQA